MITRESCFFLNHSVDLLKRRKVFDLVRKKLASPSIPALRYGIIHAAKLLATVKGRWHIFDTASGAEALVREFKADTQ